MKKNKILHFLSILLFMVSLLFSTFSLTGCTEMQTSTNQISSGQHSEHEMIVHFIDVGQGLSILAQSDGETLLYDGGDQRHSDHVVAYLRAQGVQKIDYLISSHYDADHVSGLIDCLYAFEVENVIASNYEHDTNLYLSFIEGVDNRGLEIQYPAVGTTFSFGTGEFTILSAATSNTSSNENSVAIKLSNGNHSFLFTGDADHKTEAAMINAGLDLQADVLSLGHHGSATSTSCDFLCAVTPEYAVISSGLNNQYGHPDKDILDNLLAMEIDLFRSDIQGTVTVTSDGIDLRWDTLPCNDYSPGNRNDIGTVPAGILDGSAADSIANSADDSADDSTNDFADDSTDDSTSGDTDTPDPLWKPASGRRYHRDNNCGNMDPNRATAITLEEAQASELEPCSQCY